MPSPDDILANADFMEDDAGVLEHAAGVLSARGAEKVAVAVRVRRDEWRQQAAEMRRRVAEDQRELTDAHAEGLHDIPREFCPECEAQR